MMLLKQSTAAVISFGPHLDRTDANTLEVGLVSALDHATTGIMLSKNGGALAVRHATVTASTYDAYGNYRVTLDTTDTNTLGTLRVQYCDNNTTALPVWADYMVMPATVYDALVTNATTAAGGLGDIQRMAGTALTARDIGASVLLSSGTGTGQISLSSGKVSLSNPCGLQKNTAASAFTFFLASSTDHVSPKTGATVTAQRSLDGAAFGNCANAVSEIANGFYKIDLAAADLNADVVALKFTATGADQLSITIITEP